jgi:hypothetical protein
MSLKRFALLATPLLAWSYALAFWPVDLLDRCLTRERPLDDWSEQ